MHKVKNKLEVNCANITPECNDSLTSDRISQDLQDLNEDEILKKMHKLWGYDNSYKRTWEEAFQCYQVQCRNQWVLRKSS